MIKGIVFRLVQKGSHGWKINRFFDYFIMSLILLSVIGLILESIPEINEEYSKVLAKFNAITIIIFSIEYLLRLYVSDLTHPSTNKIKSVFKYIFSIYGLIDLLAIVPFYLPMLIKMDLRFLRAVRLTRFLRVLKVNRYNDSMNLIWTVIREKKAELTVTGFVTFLILLFASFLMYHVEGAQQPDQFPNIVAAFWWAVATLTTVGYGDVYPITGLGKMISGLIAIMGIGLVALPTGLISAGFISKIEDKRLHDKRTICPHCNKEIVD